MIDSTLAFFSENGYVLELLFSSLLFTFSQEKRQPYVIRVLISAVVLLLSSMLLNLIGYHSVLFNLLKYVIWFFLMVGLCMFHSKLTFSTAVFCGIGAYACQHVAFKVGETVTYFLPAAFTPTGNGAVYLAAVLVVYVCSYFAFAKRIQKFDLRYAINPQVIYLCVAVAIYTTILQFLFVSYIHTIPTDLYLIYASFDIICCFFALSLQYGIFVASSLEQENQLMSHILHMQEEQFKLSKQNIELINIKCHDLKKQLATLNVLEETDLQKLYQTLNVYDMSVKSGNEVLDILLAEKSLLCERRHIRLECIIDGSQLYFMSVSDIYSLFGNAIDNAIESVLKVKEHDRRFINVTIKETRGLIVFHVENPYDTVLRFQGELPVTTKKDENFHGFGLKSIKMLTEKYNGYLTINTDDHVFALTIALTPPSAAT